MLDWLFEGRPVVYVLLGAAAVAAAAAWWRRRQRRYAIAAAGLLALAGLYFGLDRAVQTDREQIEARVRQMAAAVRPRDFATVERYLSDNFRSPGGRSKAEFLSLARSYRGSETVTDVVVWDFDFPAPVGRDRQPARVSFLVKVRGNLGRAEEMFYHCEADFDHTPQAGWRLRTFTLFDPTRNNERVPFPY